MSKCYNSSYVGLCFAPFSQKLYQSLKSPRSSIHIHCWPKLLHEMWMSVLSGSYYQPLYPFFKNCWLGKHVYFTARDWNQKQCPALPYALRSLKFFSNTPRTLSKSTYVPSINIANPIHSNTRKMCFDQDTTSHHPCLGCFNSKSQTKLKMFRRLLGCSVFTSNIETGRAYIAA